MIETPTVNTDRSTAAKRDPRVFENDAMRNAAEFFNNMHEDWLITANQGIYIPCTNARSVTIQACGGGLEVYIDRWDGRRGVGFVCQDPRKVWGMIYG